ncbi:RNA polymerase sigma factor [Chitinophaga qingshengii]|uniref:Sigma-70 family RNA polymerase sigma factor n=1 Tax=Chitinophaga qingshengii TaxID=1569794 RepID=A0ABR7TUG9_9BACT|nr:sigma-70 family RNA polymerase sigma factor [Chitinophaga qingshengii]MBC9934131.1 sigma-70 family RNA polymerase sigma factor [Chitinophaga qingshengii]
MPDINPPLPTSEDKLHPYFLLFQKRSPRGLAYLMEALSKSLYRFAQKRIQNEFETDTIIQDAFLWIWEHHEEIQNLQQFKRFLYNQVRWRCSKYLKSQTITTSLDLYEDKGIPLAISDLEKELEEREKTRIDEENRQLIEKAISYLHPTKKIVLELLNRGFSHKQIGKRLGRTYQAVKREENEIIKEMTVITKRLKTIAIAYHQNPIIPIPNYEAYLTPIQAKIYKLHDEKKYSLAQISIELKMTQFMALKKYQEAKWRLERLNNPKKRKYHS